MTDSGVVSQSDVAREVLRDFREYRWRVGKTIHDLGGYKGLADDFGPLGDGIESRLGALSDDVQRPTHGRHCPCSACARQDWTDPNLASCGMHGPSCPPVYAPDNGERPGLREAGGPHDPDDSDCRCVRCWYDAVDD